MPGLKTFLTCLFTLLLILPSDGWALQQGETFPAGLTGQSLSGDTISLDRFKGRPILMKIGTTWCPTCGQQSREISKLAQFLKKNDIQLIDIFVQETASKIKRYFTDNGYLEPDATLIDGGDIGRTLNLYMIPRLLFIDENFKVYRDGQPLPADKIKDTLQKMLTEK